MTGEVLGGGTDGDAALEHLQSDVGPLADGLEVHAAVDEGLRQVATTCAECIRADGDGTWDFVGLEELDGLRNGEKLEQLLGEEFIVAVIACNV